MLEVETLDELHNGRMLVCTLAPYFLLLEDTGNKSAMKNLTLLGGKMIAGLFSQGSKGGEKVRKLVRSSLEDFQELMYVFWVEKMGFLKIFLSFFLKKLTIF